MLHDSRVGWTLSVGSRMQLGSPPKNMPRLGSWVSFASEELEETGSEECNWRCPFSMGEAEGKAPLQRDGELNFAGS